MAPGAGLSMAGDEPQRYIFLPRSPPLASGFASRIADTATMVDGGIKGSASCQYMDTICG